MAQQFFERPILNSPYEQPSCHWELDDDGQPTGVLVESRRRSDLITPVPKPKKRKRKSAAQMEMTFDAGDDLSSVEQEYNPTPIINEVRTYVDQWRKLPNPEQWLVTPETERLLKHWRHHDFQGVRPFFCQVEAVETVIWLTEVAPKLGARGAKFWDHIKGANAQANPNLMRLALKLATGAGKTTVMAMLIAWQTVNAVRHPNSKTFSRGFLIVAPGITIRDRLRVLLPNDQESYYRSREIVPPDMLADIDRAKIVITNYHAFKQRERAKVAAGTRTALEGWRKEKLETVETEGQMLQRVMPDLMGMKNIVVLNDEAHHCYRERVKDASGETEADLTGDEKDEAKQANEAARMWITGLETVKKKLGVSMVYDLSATPFFLRGSGYIEGTLFPWTMCDFSLMDAIECGIVKLPRVPVADNVPGGDTPKFRNLWEHIGKDMPKKGRGSGSKKLDPLRLPPELCTALEALYGHYAKTYELWDAEGLGVPPVFIVVCNNTATSQLVYQYISGFHRENDDGTTTLENGRLPLFRNYDDFGNRLPRPNTILIDSEQLESGDALDKDFKEMAADEIERFRHINDADLKTAGSFHLERGPEPIINSIKGGCALFGLVQMPEKLPTTLVSLGRAQERWLSPILNPKLRPPYIGSWNATAMFMTALFAQPTLAATQTEPTPILPPGGPIFAGLNILHQGGLTPTKPDVADDLDGSGFEPGVLYANNGLLADLLRGCTGWSLTDVHSGVYLLGTRHPHSDNWIKTASVA